MNKEEYMKVALLEAIKAKNKKEVPIGAIIVKNGKIISRAHNLRETKKNSLYHAEIIAIDKACKKLKNFRLEDCEMYVTIEPCLMCAGAIVLSRIKKVYIGAPDDKYGTIYSTSKIFDAKSNHKVDYEAGVLEDECSSLVKNFFKDLRNKSKNKQTRIKHKDF